MAWKLVKMNGRPKIMSTKAVMIPGGEGNVIRQAVVRISSRQTMTMTDSKGRGLPGSPESREKDIVEYFVIQKIYRNWQDAEWQVWGTTNTTKLKDVQEWENMA